MHPDPLPVLEGVLVELELTFSLAELGRACGSSAAALQALVEVGVLEPQGLLPAQWRFDGTALSIARKARRLSGDLELNAAGTAIVLELLAEIRALRTRLQRGDGGRSR
jgi:chaperone modulatory protein CbpM